MRLPRRSTGFTLIELTVVLFIAGLLAVLTVTAVGGYVRRGSNLSVIADAQAIVRMVPLHAKINLCASYLNIDIASQRLEAWICGVRQKQLVFGKPYSMELIDFSLKKEDKPKNTSAVWYSPRGGGSHAVLDIYEGENRIQSIDLSAVSSYHAVK